MRKKAKPVWVVYIVVDGRIYEAIVCVSRKAAEQVSMMKRCEGVYAGGERNTIIAPFSEMALVKEVRPRPSHLRRKNARSR